MIQAKIIADSITPNNHRCITYIITFPRIVLSEFNTHRALSRNSASSRAIPFKKMVEQVKTNPFIPIAWQNDHSGMQGTEYFNEVDNPDTVRLLKAGHLHLRDAAVAMAGALNGLGLTKQVCNRYLEPFMWHTAMVTATEWDNFFSLRFDPTAEIHIAKLAELMLEEANKSEPKRLYDGQWHIPFGDTFDDERLEKLLPLLQPHDLLYKSQLLQELKIKIATARCARVSYLNFEGQDDYEADVKLHDRLLKAGHMSPFEHCCKTMSENEYFSYGLVSPSEDGGGDWDLGWSGNFRGFMQYRKTIKGENRTDDRYIKKTY
jgi:hypothetical protein